MWLGVARRWSQPGRRHQARTRRAVPAAGRAGGHGDRHRRGRHLVRDQDDPVDEPALARAEEGTRGVCPGGPRRRHVPGAGRDGIPGRAQGRLRDRRLPAGDVPGRQQRRHGGHGGGAGRRRRHRARHRHLPRRRAHQPLQVLPGHRAVPRPGGRRAGRQSRCAPPTRQAGSTPVSSAPSASAWLAPVGSVRGALFTGVLGIPADPRLIEVLGWLCYLVPSWPHRALASGEAAGCRRRHPDQAGHRRARGRDRRGARAGRVPRRPCRRPGAHRSSMPAAPRRLGQASAESTGSPSARQRVRPPIS